MIELSKCGIRNQPITCNKMWKQTAVISFSLPAVFHMGRRWSGGLQYFSMKQKWKSTVNKYILKLLNDSGSKMNTDSEMKQNDKYTLSWKNERFQTVHKPMIFVWEVIQHCVVVMSGLEFELHAANIQDLVTQSLTGQLWTVMFNIYFV